MVIHDLNVVRVAVSPPETDPPLVVDPNAVLTFPVSCQFFQPIPGWDSQVLDRLRGI